MSEIRKGETRQFRLFVDGKEYQPIMFVAAPLPQASVKHGEYFEFETDKIEIYVHAGLETKHMADLCGAMAQIHLIQKHNG